MKLAPNSTKYTAFNTCFGTFKFLRVRNGTTKLFPTPHGQNVTRTYIQIMFVLSGRRTNLFRNLRTTFSQSRLNLLPFPTSRLKLNPKKCSSAKSSCIYLGHHISKDGIKPPPNRVDALMNYPPPRNIKQLRRILGMFNWFKKYIPNYSIVVEPLTRLLRKSVKFQWSTEEERL